ncbi:hypothetical protein F2Q69_00013587 [Brassica cretica]|uniref:Aspartic peptidase DDI1-type domain-containing protein n=1 Tax=Brassica cretica TaxID=69181 RepID=A0A8S9R9Q7_BRACR|nr:hypothetical protein F2Q69_00013587 [Brassica cretica]
MSFGSSHWCQPTLRDEHRSMESDKHQSIPAVNHRSTESAASCKTIRIMTHEKFTAKHPHPPKPICVNIDRQKTSVENISEQSEDAPEPMQVDQATVGRTFRKRKEKVPKHLKRRANDKEKDSFTKRILRIPMDKPFEKAYFTHWMWMFFRETKETEADIWRMFNQVREKMRQRITLKKKSDPRKIVVMADHLGLKIEPSEDSFTFIDCSQRNSGGFIRNLEVQIGNALVPVDFHVLDIKLNWNSSLLLGRAFMATVGAVCDMQTKKLCLELIDPTIYYDPVRVVKQQTCHMEIGDDPGFIVVCHCDHKAEVESEIETSIDTRPEASTDKKSAAAIDEELEAPINSDHAKGSINSWENDYYQPSFMISTATPSKRKTCAMEPDEYDEDYREEEIIEYRGLAMEESRVLKSFHQTRGETSIDGNNKTSIDSHHRREQDAREEESTTTEYSSWKEEMNTAYTETSMDMQEHQMA